MKTIFKEITQTVISSCMLILIGILIFGTTRYLYAAYESIGVTDTNLDLRLESPNNIYFHTNLSSSEADNNSKLRMLVDTSGNVGIGVTSVSDAKLHVNGTIRTDYPTQSYHVATKQYVDNTLSGTVTLSNCVWSGTRHYSSDQNQTCLDYGAGFVQVGLDNIKDHDYIRYNQILCCQIIVQ